MYEGLFIYINDKLVVFYCRIKSMNGEKRKLYLYIINNEV